MLRPPFLSEDEGVEWALRSIRFAFELEIACCSVVPTRASNGIMEQLERDGWLETPKLSSMEAVQERGIELEAGRVFIDTWDAQNFSRCPGCSEQRIARISAMNLSQNIDPRIACAACNGK